MIRNTAAPSWATRVQAGHALIGQPLTVSFGSPVKTWHWVALSVMLLLISRVQGAPPAGRVLTSIAQIRQLTRAEAGQGYPVRLRGTVTLLHDAQISSIWVEDGGYGLYTIGLKQHMRQVQPGDRVEVTGVTEPGKFAPTARRTQVRVLQTNRRLVPLRPSLETLLLGAVHNRFIELQGTIVSTQTVTGKVTSCMLQLSTQGVNIPVRILEAAPCDAERLLDARVQVRGVAATVFNARHQFTGVSLHIQEQNDIAVVRPAAAFRHQLPVTPMANLLTYQPNAPPRSRVRVRGTVTLAVKEHGFYVQDATDGLAVAEPLPLNVHQGDLLELVGLPTTGPNGVVLQ